MSVCMYIYIYIYIHTYIFIYVLMYLYDDICTLLERPLVFLLSYIQSSIIR